MDGRREAACLKASSFYRSELWRAGLCAARLLPPALLNSIAVSLALGYRVTQRARAEVVVQNLLPALDFNRAEAEAGSRRLFRQFGLKLADLWRYEAGRPVGEPEVAAGAWDRFEAARSRGKGVLLITPHVGNWEFGAPFLRRRGISLQVITQAEPQDSLTDLRKASRARWGIETLVIGENPFAFVEVIRRLEQGVTVALLVDRPPAASAVTVQLFGRDFAASIAAAELARASGCALMPVCLPRTVSGHAVEMLPEVAYDRAGLGNRAARTRLTQQMLWQFEPVIKRHLDQWFHFVPLWKAPGSAVAS